MEPLAMEKIARKKAIRSGQAIGYRWQRFWMACCLLPVAVGVVGCVNTGSFVLPGLDKLSAPAPCEVVVAWNPEILFRPDPAHRGAPTPGLGGRMYLFGGGSDCPLTGDGCVVVDLYEDVDPKASVPTEEWRLDRDTLKRLLRRDAVGWGYTLFLPWGSYKPEIKQVQLRLRYEPAKGTPLYAESSSVVFHKANVTTMIAGQAATKPGGPTNALAAAAAQRPAQIQPGALRQTAGTNP